MQVNCPNCETEIPLYEIETDTEFVGESFETYYLCPNCETRLPREEIEAST